MDQNMQHCLMAKQDRVNVRNLTSSWPSSSPLTTLTVAVAAIRMMELDMEVLTQQSRLDSRPQWQGQLSPPPVAVPPPEPNFVPLSPSYFSRRRSTATSVRPAGPPPDHPIPSLPPSATLTNAQQPTSPISEPSDSHFVSSAAFQRTVQSTSFGRPSASPNLSAVAAFSQARQLAGYNQPPLSSSSIEDLSDPPPRSYFHSASWSSDRASDLQTSPSQLSRNHDRAASLLAPPSDSHRSEHRPSSRRALTRALELAREAVQLDSTNEDPEAAVHAYAQSVALLSAVMERVRNGEETTDSHRRRRRRSVAAQEEEIRRLQNIHDTYADRMNILSIIYSIPAVPYTIPPLSANPVGDSTASTSPSTTTPSPPSDSSPQIPPPTYTQYIQEDLQRHTNDPPGYKQDPDNPDAVYLDESVLRGSPGLSPISTSHHPYSAPYDLAPQPQPASARNSLSHRRRAGSNLPPKAPPPSSSLPQAPAMNDVSDSVAKRGESQLRPVEPGHSEVPRHRRTPSGLGALEEESDDTSRPSEDESSRLTSKRESPPLPPLPSPSSPPDAHTQPRAIPLSKPPSSPRLSSIISPRPRGTSLQTRNDTTLLANTNGATSQRKNSPSVRSSSPADSTVSAASVPYHVPSVSTMPTGSGFSARSRSSSQPGRRPSLVGGQFVQEERPPLPSSGIRNGAPRKVSVPTKLNHNAAQLQIDSNLLQSNSVNFSGNLPTTPISPLPPAPPADPLLKPYHMMSLLRITMTSQTGGYVTRRLHVPFEVWSQGGAKLTNLDEKIRVVNILCNALEELQSSSSDCFGANVNNGLTFGIGSIGRKEAESWLSKLEEFSSVCVGVVSSFGKKLGVGEGFVTRKTTLGDKITRGLDKFTNGKNLDSPASYVQGLKKLFLLVQLLDEHSRAATSQPLSQLYAAFPVDIRASAEQKLKRISEFFASVVLTFVIRDLSQLLDKYVKKCEKWLEE